MSDASENGKKSQKGALGGSPFGQNERASEPYADIDVPDYDGEIPEATAPGAKADKAAKKAGSTSASSSASKKVAKDAAPAAPGAAKKAEQAGKSAQPAAPGAKAQAGKGQAEKAKLEKAKSQTDKPQSAESQAVKSQADKTGKAGEKGSKKPAESAKAKKVEQTGKADKAADKKAGKSEKSGTAGEKTAAAGAAGTAAKADEKPAQQADTAASAEAPANAAAAEEPARPRDIYALAGRARPQRIEAPAPKPEPAAAEQPEAAAEENENLAEGEQKTEVLDLSGDGDAPAKDAADTQSRGPAYAAAGAAAGAAGGYAAGTRGSQDPAAPAAEPAQGFTAESEPAAAGEGQAEFLPEDQEQWEQAPAEGDVAYGPDGQPLAPAAAQPVETRRGTQSLGLAILRIVAGAILLVTGLQTLFGLAGDPGISALESRLSFFSGSDVLAVAIPAAEVVAGGLLILGLLTPFAAAVAFVVSAFMATFHLSGHQGSLWPYGLNPVIHQWALYALISLSLIFTGPGGASLDRSRSWATRPLTSSWIFAILGVVGFAALWLLTGGRNPF